MSTVKRRFLADQGAALAAIALSPLPREDIREGHLSAEEGTPVGARTTAEAGGRSLGHVTLGAGSSGAAALGAAEIAVSFGLVTELLVMCPGGVLERAVHHVEHAGRPWDLTVFHGMLDGLIVAEIGLASGGEEFEMPPWAANEITGDERYDIPNLIRSMEIPEEPEPIVVPEDP